MSRTSTFVLTQRDARRIADSHRGHKSTAHFGCPLCVIESRREALPRWTAPRLG